MSATVPLVWIGGQLYALGSVQGGANLAIDIGGVDKAISVKRDGTLLDAEDKLDGLSFAGSGIIAQSHGLTTCSMTTANGLSDTQALFVMVQLSSNQTVTGVKWIQTVAGIYTADQTNQVGLYSYSTGTLTLIASSSNNGNLWKSSAIVAEPFIDPTDLTPDIYWIGVVYNNSAQTTQPTIAAAANATGGAATLDLPNSGKTYCKTAGFSNSLPSSVAMSTLTENTQRPWLSLY